MRRVVLPLPAFALAASALTVMVACGRATERGSEVAPAARVYSRSEVDTEPVFKSCAEPNVSGSRYVLMQFVLGSDGIPEPVTIRVDRDRNYDQSAINEARYKLTRCKWTPALTEGEPVRVQMRYVIHLNR